MSPLRVWFLKWVWVQFQNCRAVHTPPQPHPHKHSCFVSVPPPRSWELVSVQSRGTAFFFFMQTFAAASASRDPKVPSPLWSWQLPASTWVWEALFLWFLSQNLAMPLNQGLHSFLCLEYIWLLGPVPSREISKRWNFLIDRSIFC